MARAPLTRTRSPWMRDADHDMTMPSPTGPLIAAAWRRSVGDGFLTAIVSLEPHGRHLSIAHHNHPSSHRRAERYPTWDEIADCRYTLCPDTIDMIMILPAIGDYVAHHPTTFHLHQVDNLPASAVDRPVTS